MGQTREKKPSKRSLKAQQPRAKTGKASATTGQASASTTHDQDNSPLVDASDHFSLVEFQNKPLRSGRQLSGTPTSEIDPATAQSSVEICKVAGKGFGLFAAFTIAKGALVLAEVPVIRLTKDEETDQSQAEELIQSKYELLDKVERKQYRRLHDAKKDGFSELRSIYHTNCYNLAGSRSERGGSCVGIKASRINHSCIPNVQFSFLEMVPEGLIPFINESEELASEAARHPYAGESKGVMLFYAIKKIQKGHEIVSNYESIYYTAQQRKTRLQLFYGFTCDCRACTDSENAFWSRSDDRRRGMIRLKREVADFEHEWRRNRAEREPHTPASGGQFDDAEVQVSEALSNVSLKVRAAQSDVSVITSVLERLLELLDQEGLGGIELVDTYHRLWKWSSRSYEPSKAKKWVELERDAARVAFGSYSARLKDITARLQMCEA